MRARVSAVPQVRIINKGRMSGVTSTSSDTFLNYRGYRWLWANVLLVVALVVWYMRDNPIGGSSGGSVYGFTVGGIATAGILYLMWFGVRKRSYHSRNATLKGWLAAHVWLGIALAIIVPLHAGFQFGFNVHTLAYALMVAVIISGIWGALNYSALAAEVQSHRGGGTVKDLVEQIHIVEQNIDSVVAKKSDQLIALKEFVSPPFVARFWSMIFGKPHPGFASSALGPLVAAVPAEEGEDAISVIKLADRKRDLVNRVQHDVKTLAILKLWLYLHLPLSLALVVVVAIHIFVVFFYRG